MCHITAPVRVLEFLRHSQQDGRPVLPLAGAGLSTHAGVPGTPEIGAYLAKIHFRLASVAIERKETPSDSFCTEYLTENGWPDLTEVNRLVVPRSYCLAPPTGADTRTSYGATLQKVTAHGLAIALGETPAPDTSLPTSEALTRLLVNSWRVLLRRLTSGNSALIESFFDTLTKSRRPSTSHFLLPLLSDLLGYRLLLTTNFDTLLEQALTALRIDHQVFELGENQSLPNTGLVENAFSVIKLHGGRFGIGYDDVLDRPFDQTNTQRFLEYLPTGGVLLVVGYRGTDRRVLSLIREFIHRGHDSQDGPRLIWTYRTRPPATIVDLSRHAQPHSIRFVRVDHLDLFLQECCEWLTQAFPALPETYCPFLHNAAQTFGAQEARLVEIPGSTPSPRQTPQEGDTAGSFIVLYSDVSGAGTTTRLAQLCHEYRGTHHVVCCDMEQIGSLDALIHYLMNEFIRVDPNLPPLVLPSTARGHNSVSDTPRHTIEEQSRAHDYRVDRTLEALQRGKYLIAIDSTGEFGRSQLAHDLMRPASRLTEKVREIFGFLTALAARASEFGESVVALVHCPVNLPSDYDDVEFAPRVKPSSFLPNPPVVFSPPQTESQSAAAVPPPSSGCKSTKEQNVSVADSNDQQLRVPERFGPYQVVERIGAGQFGAVYKVYDTELKKHLAAKFLKPSPGILPGDIDEYLEEARRVGGFHHPNIVTVHAAGRTEAGLPFIIYDYVSTGSIDVLTQSPMPPRQVARIVLQVARAFEYLHSKCHVVHCDVKPANILMDSDGTVYLTDFGLALSIESLQDRQSVCGTLPYMSPEQICGDAKDVSAASDLYSLGVVMYELLTGRKPFVADTRSRLRTAICNREPVPPERYGRRIPREVSRICLKCLRKDPADRYGDARVLAEDLSRWICIGQDQEELSRLYHGVLHTLESLSKSQSITLVPVQPTRKYITPNSAPEFIARLLRRKGDSEGIGDRIVACGNTVIAAVPVLWDELQLDYQRLLSIAAAFRRPRSFVSLSRIWQDLGGIPAHSVGGFLAGIEAARPDPSALADNLPGGPIQPGTGSFQVPRSELMDELRRLLGDLEDAGILIRQEGGCYWMHTAVRNYIYEEVGRQSSTGMGDLHELIAATYYDDTYLRSGAVDSFFEFVFHQVSSMRGVGGSKLVRRLRLLSTALGRERDALIGKADCSTLLEYVRSIREVELKRIEREAAASEEAVENQLQLGTLIRQLRGFLCDLEAEVLRGTTHYQECVSLRLRQISDRIVEIGLCSQVGDVCETLRRSWSEGDLDGVRSGFDRILTEIQAHVREMAGEATEGLLRLTYHIMDVAVCLQGLNRPQSEPLFMQLRAFCEALGKIGVAPAVRNLPERLNVLGARCSLRMMESWDAGVHAWESGESRESRLAAISVEYPVAITKVEQYPAWAADEYRRHKCHLNTLSARAHYLQGRFSEAYRLLENARVSVEDRLQSGGHIVLAVCKIRKAECLMMHADQEVRGLGECSGGWRIRSASALLGRAGSALLRARQLLREQNGGVWRWTLYFLMEAQLRHEEVLLTLFQHVDGHRSSRSRRLQIITSGLRAIGAALDNISKDSVRFRQVEMLWWQFFLVFVFIENSEPESAWSSWRVICDSAGLGWFCEVQETNNLPEYERRFHSVWDRIFLSPGDVDSRERALNLEAAVLEGARSCRIGGPVRPIAENTQRTK